MKHKEEPLVFNFDEYSFLQTDKHHVLFAKGYLLCMKATNSFNVVFGSFFELHQYSPVSHCIPMHCSGLMMAEKMKGQNLTASYFCRFGQPGPFWVPESGAQVPASL